jgi:hypothetical protein
MILHNGQFPPMEHPDPGTLVVTVTFTRLSTGSDSFQITETKIEKGNNEDSGRRAIL